MKRIIIALLSIITLISCEQKQGASDPCSVVDSFLEDVKTTNREDYKLIVGKYFVQNFWERDSAARDLTFDAFDEIKKMNISCEHCKVSKEFGYEVVRFMSEGQRGVFQIKRIGKKTKIVSCVSFRKHSQSERIWL